MRAGRAALAVLAALALPACGRTVAPPADALTVTLWHTQTQEMDKALAAAAASFERASPGVRVERVYGGNYTQVYQKVLSSLGGGSLPDMAVAYESMAADYFERGALRPLDDLLDDPTDGIPAADRGDFQPGFLELGRFPSLGNRQLTFPFTKSVLALYANLDLLKEAGFDGPPATWEALVRQGEAVSKRRGKPCFPFSGDVSTLHGMILSCGGRIEEADGGRARYDTEAGRKAFGYLRALREKGVLFRVTPKTEEDLQAFARGDAAFAVRSSVARASLEARLGDRIRWTVAPLPHAEGSPPATVLYGGNLVIFRTTPERERACWRFLKHFSSPAVTAEWSRATGYLPVRRSSLDVPSFRAFVEANPRNRAALDSLPFARPEPSAKGWQAVRDAVEEAIGRVLGRGEPLASVLPDLERKANEALDRARRP